jgi:hypothetical protein
VGGQRVMGHQLVGDLFRERCIQPARDVDGSQCLVLGLVLCLEFRTLTREVGLFGIRLRIRNYNVSVT